jgi:hypothetical protein
MALGPLRGARGRRRRGDLALGLLDREIGRQQRMVAPAGQSGHLRAAGFFQLIDRRPCLARRAAQRQRAMVAQQQKLLVRAKVGLQPLALVQIERHAFVIVIAKPRDDIERALRKRQQPFGMGRGPHPVAGGKWAIHCASSRTHGWPNGSHSRHS